MNSHAQPTETAAGHNRQVRDTALTSKREAIDYLRAQLNITGVQANRLYSAYQRDLADAIRIGNNTRPDDTDFIAWLMQQTPSARRPTTRQWRLGETAWRTTS